MAEAGHCESCVFFHGKPDECEYLFKACDLHRNIQVQMSLTNAIKPDNLEQIGYSIIDPQQSVCGRYLYSPISLLSGSFFNKDKDAADKKKAERQERKEQKRLMKEELRKKKLERKLDRGGDR